MNFPLRAVLATFFLLPVQGHVATAALPNGDFEQGLQAWVVRDVMSKAVPEAAREGKLGLRVTDDDPATGSSAMSAKLPVKSGQAIGATFWARSDSAFSGVYLWFFDGKGKVVKDPAHKNSDGFASVQIKQSDSAWREYTLSATAPNEAASVAIWIHTYSTPTGIVDFDDFTLSGIAEGAKPLIAKQEEPAEPVALPQRAKPPVIVIKVDDLRQVNGRVPLLWVRFADVLKSRGIKGSIGIICKTLEEATPEYTGWVKDQQASGRIEFWFHGYTHDVRTESGKQYGEFTGRDLAEQTRRFDISQKLAQEKLGFPFRTFGPPGGAAPSFDGTTIQVMAADSHMSVWLYPTPLDEQGRKLAADGKVTILDRVWDVNLESAVGLPSFSRFVSGYAKHPDREYFVLQGHTAQWGAPGRFDEAVKIIDFLIAQKARFVTPMELAEELRSRSPAKR